jgi:cell shape-determining protein MreD
LCNTQDFLLLTVTCSSIHTTHCCIFVTRMAMQTCHNVIHCRCCFSSTVYLLTILFHNNRQEIAVRIVTRLGARWWWNCGLIPARGKRIFSSPFHPDQLWGLQSLCLVDNVSSFPRKE